ncbi:MAG: cupin domain-containing protein, partial [Bacteroidota bacterium]
MEDQPKPIISHPSEGRRYELGAKKNTEVLFKADGAEVANQYAITEWWMEQGAPGPAPHVHENNNELIYVLAGPVAILIEDEWKELDKGGLAVIPAGTTHTFANKSDQRVGILNIVVDSAYEAMMPQITA